MPKKVQGQKRRVQISQPLCVRGGASAIVLFEWTGCGHGYTVPQGTAL